MERPVLYTHTCCPYAQRVLMAMLHKGVPFDLVQVDLSDKPAWYRGVNPRGLVPAVTWRGEAVTESVDVVRWLDEAFVGAASLTPADPALRAAMDGIIDQAAPAVVSAGLDAVAGTMARSWAVGAAASRGQLARLEAAAAPLAASLEQHGGPFLAGPHLSAADVVVYPFLERFALALQIFQAYDLVAIHGGALARWMADVRRLPSAQLACAPEERLAAALRQHWSLDWFDYCRVDVGDLHPQLLRQAQVQRRS